MKHSIKLWEPAPNTAAWDLMLVLIQTENVPLNSPVFDEVMALHDAATEELVALQKNEEENQAKIEIFKELLILAINVVKTPKNINLANQLKERVEQEAQQRPMFSGKFLGALMAVAAAVLIGLSLFAVPLLGTINAQYIGGSLLAAGGAALFWRGMENTQDRFMNRLAALADKTLTLTPELK